MFLQTIKKQDVFHTSIPAVPMGKYVHLVVLRETNSFPLFQTDQELNFARVSAGRNENGFAQRHETMSWSCQRNLAAENCA